MPELDDYNHRRIAVPDSPERIVSFSPAITEILYELGLGDRIVGITAFCSRPAETAQVRKIGSYSTARLDILEELNPDIILTVSGYPNKFALELAKKFPVYTFELPSSVSGIVDLVSRVGIVTGKVEESKYMEFELLKYLGSMRRRPRISGYVELDLGGPTSFGSLSYITDALSMLGIQSIYSASPSEWLSPDLNFVKEKDPEVIFYEPKMYSKFSEADLKEIIDRRGWNDLKAVRENHLFSTPGELDFFAHHGPSFIREVLPWAMERIENI